MDCLVGMINLMLFMMFQVEEVAIKLAGLMKSLSLSYIVKFEFYLNLQALIIIGIIHLA